MGGHNSYCPLTTEELQEYEGVTGMNTAEITQAFKKFYKIDPLTFMEHRKGRIPYLTVAETLPELKNNPFRYRIGKVFCSSETGFMDFDDFLEMAAAMHDKTPLNVRLHWAFQIYDINEDGVICENDLDKMLDLLTDNRLLKSEKEGIILRILSDGDTDADSALSFQEFERSISLNWKQEFEE
ncbi:calcium and integrin-binding family member 3-like [Halichondria panicea]|uniref:calcium and integrin-binding family member 3-like n=1 Tax=Halichondria panicea TaxID=6063 RepID=UPI00312B5A6D